MGLWEISGKYQGDIRANDLHDLADTFCLVYCNGRVRTSNLGYPVDFLPERPKIYVEQSNNFLLHFQKILPG